MTQLYSSQERGKIQKSLNIYDFQTEKPKWDLEITSAVIILDWYKMAHIWNVLNVMFPYFFKPILYIQI